MKAEPAHQRALLDLQRLDLEIDRNSHRAKTLPEIARYRELEAKSVALRDHTTAAATRVSDLSRELRKAEADVEQVRARSQRDQALLNSGQVNSPKQLADLEHEVGSLARRQSELEDAELAAMEALETAESEHGALVTQGERVAAELAGVKAARDEALALLKEELQAVQLERVDAARPIPAELLNLYGKVRADTGTGAAMVRRGRCEACQMELPQGDLDEIRQIPADEVARCPVCRSIMVRTEESGL